MLILFLPANLLAVMEVMSSIRIGQIDLAPRAAWRDTADCSHTVFSGCHLQKQLCQHISLNQPGEHSSIL